MAISPARIKNIPLFKGIEENQLKDIAVIASEELLAKGSIVIQEGESTSRLSVLISGLIKILKTSSEGREQTLEILKPGDVVNAVSAVDGLPSTASAITLTPCTVIHISMPSLEPILGDNATLTMNLARILAHRVRTLANLVEDLSFKNVTNRIAKILLENVTEPGSGKSFTHQDMAAMAGTAREVVSRSLKSLESQGVIRLDRHSIVITNSQTLKKIAMVS